jgi:hypothetical protein
MPGHVLEGATGVVAERATLLRRIAYLRKTKKLLEVRHVLHRPLAVRMVVVVAMHLGTALSFGYASWAR